MPNSYRPAPWLPNGHLMTMWGKFFRRSELPVLRLEQLDTPDGDSLTLATAEEPRSGPRLLVLHGLEGGLRSHYVGGLWAVARRRGWQPSLMMFRTCDGKLNNARRTYHSGETSDVRLVLERFIRESSSRPIGLVGTSLGGNVLLKYLGEEGDSLSGVVRAAAAVSTPFDLARSSRAIGSGFSRVYEWNFLRSLKRKAGEKLLQYPDICSREALNAVRSMWEFDDKFTAPLHGFRDAADYYDRCSSIRFLDRIRRATLLLSARDDPFYSPDILVDVEKISVGNSDLTLEFHARGGHAGFVGGVPWRPTYHMETRVIDFLESHVGPDHSNRPGVVGAKGVRESDVGPGFVFNHFRRTVRPPDHSGDGILRPDSPCRRPLHQLRCAHHQGGVVPGSHAPVVP